jgi:hypothetical protein
MGFGGNFTGVTTDGATMFVGGESRPAETIKDVVSMEIAVIDVDDPARRLQGPVSKIEEPWHGELPNAPVDGRPFTAGEHVDVVGSAVLSVEPGLFLWHGRFCIEQA